MPRQRSPERDRAFAVFQEHGGNIANREIAKQLGIPEKTVGGWKVKDNWNGVLQTNERSTSKRKVGAPKGNKNAVGNTGGPGGPVGNDKAISHGFFRRIFPDDDETHAILGAIELMDPLDILWQNIVIQYTAIARAQRLMFVQDQEDHTQVLKRRKDSDASEEREWEFQFSWDKHAAFLQAQSRAITTLERLIAQYEASLPHALKREEQRLRIDKLKAEVDRMRNPDGEGDTEDDGFLEALKGRGSELWDGGDDDEG